MPANCTRDRLEWVPGNAAAEALTIAEQLFPDLKRQDLIDKLILYGVVAATHEPLTLPSLVGRNRNRWLLPGTLAQKRNPGKTDPSSG